MVFTYLNVQTVWDSFCGTYEAIYDLLGDFDTWYAQNGAAFAIPSLQDEWKEFIRVTLDSMVLRSRATFDTMYQNRKFVPFHTRSHTYYIYLLESHKVEISTRSDIFGKLLTVYL